LAFPRSGWIAISSGTDDREGGCHEAAADSGTGASTKEMLEAELMNPVCLDGRNR
jgi:hypothetical protein